MSDIEKRFDAAMMDIYRRALAEAKYPATRYFQMLSDHGGVETAHLLLNTDAVSDGYTALWERKRLDLTVEALVFHNPDFQTLFTDEEVSKARKRLSEYGYVPAIGGGNHGLPTT